MKLFVTLMACGMGLMLGSSNVYADKVELTNTEGKSITVDLITYTDTEVEARLLAGARRVVNIPLSSLSSESKSLIQEWKDAGGGLSQDFEVDVKISKSTEKQKVKNNNSRRSGRNNSRNSNRNQNQPAAPVAATVQMTVSVENSENNMPTAGNEMKAILVGRSVAESGTYLVLDVQHELLPALEPRESKEFEFLEISHKYLDGKKENSYGAKYAGYVVLIFDAHGEVVGGKSVPTNWFERNLENLVHLQAGQFYDSDFMLSSYREAAKK